MASEKKDKLEAQIKSVDMTEDMQQEAVEVAIEAMDKYHIEKDIAQYIKREFDSRKGATWHCVVGRNFGSFVTHVEDMFGVPVIPLATHKYKEVTCYTCRFTQDLRDRPDITPETRPPPGVVPGQLPQAYYGGGAPFYPPQQASGPPPQASGGVVAPPQQQAEQQNHVYK
ncbi:rhodopsin family protein [Aspergillus niger]|uniref:Dynein light chain n=1 Tax=Aspergillus niger TaxID=5061 RepID=A0A100I2J3_ASPNG|nr:rhodopsin family protein [Aspergillus niger]